MCVGSSHQKAKSTITPSSTGSSTVRNKISPEVIEDGDKKIIVIGNWYYDTSKPWEGYKMILQKGDSIDKDRKERSMEADLARMKRIQATGRMLRAYRPLEKVIFQGFLRLSFGSELYSLAI